MRISTTLAIICLAFRIAPSFALPSGQGDTTTGKPIQRGNWVTQQMKASPMPTENDHWDNPVIKRGRQIQFAPTPKRVTESLPKERNKLVKFRRP
ncbi:hypothetical protein F5148DRAFT_1155790 [Russula earlei]|uniref:Uncharacterized protein n=1 Tax=Russula earlei TaxID=71964 RepID=A0ACC0UQS9_9AGAM|nr:hypothetical protein F5148DRAFT_1155790 [Russula earlei]